MSAEKTDHKAEALREARQYAEAADREAAAGNLEPATTFAFTSQAYSNLAIAEGQERVAEALESIRSELAAPREWREQQKCSEGQS